MDIHVFNNISVIRKDNKNNRFIISGENTLEKIDLPEELSESLDKIYSYDFYPPNIIDKSRIQSIVEEEKTQSYILIESSVFLPDEITVSQYNKLNRDLAKNYTPMTEKVNELVLDEELNIIRHDSDLVTKEMFIQQMINDNYDHERVINVIAYDGKNNFGYRNNDKINLADIHYQLKEKEYVVETRDFFNIIAYLINSRGNKNWISAYNKSINSDKIRINFHSEKWVNRKKRVKTLKKNGAPYADGRTHEVNLSPSIAGKMVLSDGSDKYNSYDECVVTVNLKDSFMTIEDILTRAENIMEEIVGGLLDGPDEKKDENNE